MIKYRRIVKKKDSKFQNHQIILVVLIITICLSFLLTFILYNFFKKYLLYNFILSTILLSLIIFCLVVSLKNREQVSVLEIDKMNKEANKLATRINKLFNDKTITDVLKLSNSTRYGEEMPEIYVFLDSSLKEGFIAIENISNFDRADRDKFEQKISGVLSGKYQKYSVVSSELTLDDSFILFYFEDTITSERLIINNTGDIKENVSKCEHHIRLAKNLVWQCNITAHLSIIARTRAGKSVLAGEYMARLMLLQNWIVEYNSAKYDRYVKEFNGKSDPIEIVERAEYWCSVMDNRLQEINNAGKDKYLDMKDMPNIAIFFDELGNLNASLESLDKTDKTLKITSRWITAINRLSATGASAGIHIIAISQFATKEGFLPSLARVNCSDAVIMLGGAADSPTERQYLMSGFADLPKRSYKKGQGIARIQGSGRKWETPHFYETPFFKEIINSGGITNAKYKTI